MPRRHEEQEKWEKEAYGYTWEKLMDIYNYVHWDDYFDVLNFSISIQSDIQWMIENDEDREKIRQAMNVSKRCIDFAKNIIRKDPVNGSELRKLGH